VKLDGFVRIPMYDYRAPATLYREIARRLPIAVTDPSRRSESFEDLP
jgi:hypothetical protein